MKTDHPKYLALVGQLNHWPEPEHPADLFHAIELNVVEIHSDDSYPALSSRANGVFAKMAETISPSDAEDATPLGTDLYVRVRDVGPLVTAARRLLAARDEFFNHLGSATDDQLHGMKMNMGKATNELAEALKKVEDLQP